MVLNQDLSDKRCYIKWMVNWWICWLFFSVTAKSRQHRFGFPTHLNADEQSRRTLETLKQCRKRLHTDKPHVRVINAWIVTDDVIRPGTPNKQQHATLNSARRWHSNSSLDYAAVAEQISKDTLATDDGNIAKQQAYFRSLVLKMPTTVANDRMAVSNNNNNNDADKLPVVELKPFITSTKKEWRPSNSWVDSLDFEASMNSQTSGHHQPPPPVQTASTQNRPVTQQPVAEQTLPAVEF